MTQEICLDACGLDAHGIGFAGRRLANGDIRATLYVPGDNNTSIIIPARSGWGLSRYHKGLASLVIVAKGFIKFSKIENDGSVSATKNLESSVEEIFPGKSYNIYSYPDCCYYQIFFGKAVANPNMNNLDIWPANQDTDQLLRSVKT